MSARPVSARPVSARVWMKVSLDLIPQSSNAEHSLTGQQAAPAASLPAP